MAQPPSRWPDYQPAGRRCLLFVREGPQEEVIGRSGAWIFQGKRRNKIGHHAWWAAKCKTLARLDANAAEKNTTTQSQTAVTAYLKSKQLLLFGFAWQTCTQKRGVFSKALALHRFGVVSFGPVLSRHFVLVGRYIVLRFVESLALAHNRMPPLSAARNLSFTSTASFFYFYFFQDFFFGGYFFRDPVRIYQPSGNIYVS